MFGFVSLVSCTTTSPPTSPVRHVGAMREVMWEGRLGAQVDLDTLAGRRGLYAVGPLTQLAGEITVVDGDVYVSRVTSDTTMSVERKRGVGAPFLVYAEQTDWAKTTLPADVTDLKSLEAFVDERSADAPRPFVFLLKGTIDSALIHVQNLPPGTRVRSPKDGHRGQVKYPLGKHEVTVVGFFSTEHQGVFTHHDSYVHLHLLAADEAAMGHVDEIAFGVGEVELWMPG